MIYKIRGIYPKIHKTAFVAQSADIVGDVILEELSNVWFGAVLRGDTNTIKVGKKSNIQDNCVLHSDKEDEYVIDIGENVTVGHGAILHGCKIGNNCLIGMGSIILNGVEIGENTIIGAGSLVTSNKKIPSGVLCMGSPAKVIRELTEEEKKAIIEDSKEYLDLSKNFK
ncbi:gamma carbonic anhydrase family protein [Clostridium niameyense]|uniref:Gamma carbonic anhydrase family protein n=1 Tax=Clostridium niameyense TaxID=1622073 RepID=A0A6M0RBC7_9CLOT|nr:gamma carbonic anhydrase family protein [Clostridium niameyense]NEZ47523.1 gamma carbonic anhydrase family protein [Clostridium niameyense]